MRARTRSCTVCLINLTSFARVRSEKRRTRLCSSFGEICSVNYGRRLPFRRGETSARDCLTCGAHGQHIREHELSITQWCMCVQPAYCVISDNQVCATLRDTSRTIPPFAHGAVRTASVLYSPSSEVPSAEPWHFLKLSYCRNLTLKNSALPE